MGKRCRGGLSAGDCSKVEMRWNTRMLDEDSCWCCLRVGWLKEKEEERWELEDGGGGRRVLVDQEAEVSGYEGALVA